MKLQGTPELILFHCSVKDDGGDAIGTQTATMPICHHRTTLIGKNSPSHELKLMGGAICTEHFSSINFYAQTLATKSLAARPSVVSGLSRRVKLGRH